MGVEELRSTGGRAEDDVIGEHEDEGLVFEQRLRLLHSVRDADRLALFDEVEVSEPLGAKGALQEALVPSFARRAFQT